jgi:curved DNA-binding protein CbpA
MKDQYAVLGLQRSASDEQIKAVYRRLAEDPGNRARLAEFQEAHALLTDPGAREIYDQSLRFSAAEATRPKPAFRPAPLVEPLEPEPRSSRFWLMALLVAMIVGGMSLYAHFSKEQERLRLEREREIHLRAQQAEAERKEREAADQEAREEQQRRREIADLERKNQMDSERSLHEVDRRSERSQMELERQERREAQEARQREWAKRNEEERQERLRREREAHNRWIIERPSPR